MLLTFRSWYVLLCFFSYEVISDELDGSSEPIRIPCAVRKDISPCTCDYHTTTKGFQKPWINVACQKMNSFTQIISVLQNKFEKNAEIHLTIEYSNLEDMSKTKFSDMKTVISWILLRNNVMTELPNSTFEGINTVTHLQLHDSTINQFPGTIFEHLPNVHVLSIERTLIKSVSPSDFKSLKRLKNLIIRECNLTIIENGTFPQTLNSIVLSDNNITTLNHTLRNNFNLNMVVLKNNNIDSLSEQVPDYKQNGILRYLDVSWNKLTSLPESFGNLKHLNMFSAVTNKLTTLNNVFTRSSRMSDLDLTSNQIYKLSRDEFEGCSEMKNLNVSKNEISNLNRSLVPLSKLENLNLTNNHLTEFSLDEIRGLRNLNTVALCHNQITKFIGKQEIDTLPLNITIHELRLEFNELQTLEGSIGEITGLVHLNMSYNKLETLPADFLNGLAELQVLDVSHNLLHSLEDTSKARLPSLGEFYAAYNKITNLNKIFSAVCFMHLEYNKIEAINLDSIEDNPCVYRPGANATLYVFLDGNEVLCKEDNKKTIDKAGSKNNTKIVGQCPRTVPNDELKYNVNNTDSSPITLVTLGEREQYGV